MNMDLTISMNTVLNFLHSMALSTSNKQWLADHLYEEVKAEQQAAATTNNGWPKIRREDMRISPEVANLVKGFELPEDADYDQLKLEYLMKKECSSQENQCRDSCHVRRVRQDV